MDIYPRASPSVCRLNVFFIIICQQEGFADFFHVADTESTVRNALFTIAGFAGIGATLALVFR